MDINKLRQLIKQEEGPKLDFKAELNLTTESEKRELTKDVIAIANSRGGRGYIVFGIEDKTKRIIGVNPGDFSEEQIQQIIYNRCDPPVPISVDFLEDQGKLVAVLSIYRSSHKPHQMLQNGSFYIRRGSTTDTARRSEIANLFQENGLMTFETVIVKNSSMNDLNFEIVRQFLSNVNVTGDNPSEVLLEAIGIIGERVEGEGYHPTIGGLLLFGRTPALFLPHSYIKIIWPDGVKLVQGNILEMLDEVSALLGEIITDEDYPLEAVEEVIANALVHRDYLDVSRGITVVVSSKNIEVSNPGSLISGNSPFKYQRENNPDRRNPWLYQRLLTLDSKKRFLKSGIGMMKIRKAFQDIREVKFLNIGSQNLFKVILPRDLRKAANGGEKL